MKTEQDMVQALSRLQPGMGQQEFANEQSYFGHLSANAYAPPYDHNASTLAVRNHQQAPSWLPSGYSDSCSFFSPSEYAGREYAGRVATTGYSERHTYRGPNNSNRSPGSSFPTFHPQLRNQRVGDECDDDDDDKDDLFDELKEFQCGSIPSQPAGDSDYNLKTTLMIRNIPLVYTQEMLLLEWPNHNSYDFLYLPCITYAFVNFTTEAGALDFIRRWQQLRLPRGRSKKPLNISFAVVQGLANNLKRWKRKRTWRLSNRSKPLVFQNGVQIPLEQMMHCV
jgi:hypothetical protein